MSPTALDLWEAGAATTPASRALLLLRAAGHEEAAGWPVTVRDRALLTAYCPSRLQAVVQCRGCDELLDVDVDARAMAGHPPPEGSVTVDRASHRVRARLPSAADLAALDPGAAPQELALDLLRSCVEYAERAGRSVEVTDLPPEVLEAVDDALAAADRDGGLTLQLTCAACGASWSEILDPVRFAWAEVEDGARALAVEVHTLASAYGWSESEILALSPSRRRLYLSVVGP